LNQKPKEDFMFVLTATFPNLLKYWMNIAGSH